MLKKPLFFIIIAILAACGGPTHIKKPNDDLATLLEVVKLDAVKQQIIIRLTHRQAKIRDASTLHCQLQINDDKPVPLAVLQTPELTASAREILTWSIPNSLDIPRQARINYVFDCLLSSANSRDERFKSRGILYRLGNQEPPVYR